MKKTIILLRHAKAEAGADDHARPLAERGREEAAKMGAYMTVQGVLPQRIICSTSERTRETLERLFPVVPEKVIYSDDAYNASENQLLQIIAGQPENISSLMMIAHNPGLHQLALRLARVGDDAGLRHLASDFPPCTLVVVEYESAQWKDIKSSGAGVLTHYATPKLLS